MKTIQATKTKNTTETDSGNLRGTDAKKSVSPKNLIFIGIEAMVIGFSLFTAFVIQQTYLEIPHHQFLFGPGEMLRMSAGISFCYAFIAVLRRSYLSRLRLSAMDVFKQVSRYVLETYIIFLALLFMVHDISLKSTRLALGSGLVLSVVLLFLYRLIAGPKFFARKTYPDRRKIILKKSAPSADSKDHAEHDPGEKTELLIESRDRQDPPIARIKDDIDGSLQNSGRYHSSRNSRKPKIQN